MHPSLTDLLDQAPACAEPAQLRGFIAESHDLARNALRHGEAAVTVARWYSRLTARLLGSPSLADEPPVIPVGALARGEALPSTPLLWVAPRIPSVQSGFWEMGRDLGTSPAPPSLDQALRQRPPAMRTLDGLPDLDATVSIQEHLLGPAALLRQCAHHLTQEENESLTQAWITGMELEAQRWRDRVPSTLPARDLPALQRSAFGAAARSLSLVIRSVAARNTITIDTDVS
ncbi:hypothetical protein H7347_07085 [Corynebacterium sp. zg-331]|uniref:hypothetical protein n=1 Tax=unclassified Corynebacterium TaxID=2624378 RepID=UPI00128E8B03|nr:MULTISPECIES: hypothetical protein [unclassified Corynebacterium]MBC3186336.1 hypothetical protein [Corynebacterium sp. zg-331]MPV52823.1 hypothetical protein [Corynebacterium sp. zg331]